MVNKLSLPPTPNEVIGKINEIIDDKQDKLTAGTNIEIDPDTNTISATSGYAEIIFRKWSDD